MRYCRENKFVNLDTNLLPLLRGFTICLINHVSLPMD